MNRILAVHRGSLGDFLLLAPVLAELRLTFPEARIEGLGHTEIMALLCPGILDSTESVERATLVPFFEEFPDLPRREAEFFRSFDLVLAYVSDPERKFEQNLERLGIKNLIVRPAFPPAGERIHVSRYLLSTVASLLDYRRELEVANEQRQHGRNQSHAPKTFLHFTEDENRWTADFLEPALSSGRPLVAIHPGSGAAKKCWPPDRFEAIARQLEGEGGCGGILVLGPADERLAERTRSLSSELGCVIAHNLPLRRLAATLSKCSAYIGNDSGVTHLAATTGIPTVAIFGPTDPAVWAPLGPNVKVITSAVECRPCTRETMRNCDREACLEEVVLHDVLKCLQNILKIGAFSG